MFGVSDNNAAGVQLQQAILLYGATSHSGSISYATIHPVDTAEGDASPVIRAGRPVDKVALREVVAGLLDASRVRSGVLPDNILSIGPDFVVWWERPCERTYYFDCRRGPEGSDAASVGKRAGKGFVPGLVFVAKNQSMMVFAVKGSERPTLDTPLFHAPLMNVWVDGRVCTGSMPLPDSTMAESVATWSRSFWESNFSHPNHAKVVKYKGGIHAFTNDLLDGKFKKFPDRILQPIKGRTLGGLVDQLDGVKS